MSRWLSLALLFLAACSSSQDESSLGGRSAPSKAESLEAAGNWAGAAAIYREAIAEGGNARAYVRLAQLYHKLGRANDALAVMEEAEKNLPGDAEILNQLGLSLIDAGKPEKAVSVFEALSAMEPDNAMFLNGRAVAFDYAGNHAAAQEIYQRALSLAPESLSIQNNLALSMILNGQVSEAIRLLKPLAKNGKATATLRQNLALAYSLKGDRTLALEISQQDLDPDQAKENVRFYEQYKRLRKQKENDGDDDEEPPTN